MVVKKGKKKKKKPAAILAIGFDISTYSIAGCARSYDPLLKKHFGPRWTMLRWNKEDHVQWDKLRTLANAYEFIFELQDKLGAGGVIRDYEHIHIGVEELPATMMNSKSYREQAELFGAFVSGLLKFGYTNVYSVPVPSWQKLVRDELGISMKEFDKFSVKEWAREVHDAPKWRDLIRNERRGLIVQPKKSKAKPGQPDDRYDATGILQWVWETKLGFD